MPRRLIFSSFTTTSYLENPTSSSRFTSFKSSSLPKWSHFGGFSLSLLFFSVYFCLAAQKTEANGGQEKEILGCFLIFQMLILVSRA